MICTFIQDWRSCHVNDVLELTLKNALDRNAKLSIQVSNLLLLEIFTYTNFENIHTMRAKRLNEFLKIKTIN